MPANASVPRGPRQFQSPDNDVLAETVARIEASTLRNPLAAVAIAAGAGFLLSKMRAEKRSGIGTIVGISLRQQQRR